MKRKFSDIELVCLSVVTVLLLWEVFSRIEIFNIHLFPPPSHVFFAIVDMLHSGELQLDMFLSIQRALFGYFLGCLLGVFFGVLTGRMRAIELTVGSLIQILRPIPAIAVVPLIILWFGLGESSKYMLVIWGVFFPVWMNTHIGIQNVNKELIWAAKSLGANERQILLFVVLPAALGHVIAGMRTAIGVAFICLVAAEMAGAFAGLGYRIEASQLVFRTDKMIAAILMLGLLGALSDFTFSKVLHRFFPWYTRVNEQSGNPC